ncbi:hypothetical protein ACHRV6_22700 [Flavobacterium sp. FlaQc-51]|uniref:hypothetical protein n=1 Tax=Flavobacterium sp. FlaQc-51 TaxID=3374184 RepID=UPI0037579A90
MNLHEKSLELNITHELLNLADSFNWHLTNITLWRYWEPSYDHFRRNDYKKSTAYGLHSNVEGKDDEKGNAGGGYDVKIKSGQNESVVFIQYKKGKYSETKPVSNEDGNRSIFNVDNTKYFKFELNSTATNQHFKLRKLSDRITQQNGNAVVYAFPLIRDIPDLDNNAGKIIRRTKFISIKDIDAESVRVGRPFQLDDHHSYRICAQNMENSELNYYYYYYGGFDSSVGIICDTIILGIQKALQNFIKNVNASDEDFKNKFIEILEKTISSYKNYIFDYFEVPINFDLLNYYKPRYYNYETNQNAYPDSLTKRRDIEIVYEVVEYLKLLFELLKDFEPNSISIPPYKPKHFTLNVELNIDFKSRSLHNVSMIKI